MAALSLAAFEVALSAGPGNGGAAPSAEVRYTIGRLAVAAPHMALRLPHVRAAMDPVDLATARALVTPQAATPAPPQPPEPPVSVQQVARVLAISPQAVRAAAKRGTLRGQRDRITGEWRFKSEDVETYASNRRGRGTHSGRGTARRNSA
jgi:excisionase family DNA binding protein